MAGNSEFAFFNFAIFIFFLQVANLLTQAAGMKAGDYIVLSMRDHKMNRDLISFNISSLIIAATILSIGNVTLSSEKSSHSINRNVSISLFSV